MRAVGYACDVCDKFASSSGEDGEKDPPEDWFRVIRRGEITDVCSPACLCKLGRETVSMEKAKPPAGGDDGRADCPVPGCDKRPKVGQGMTMHLNKAHPDLGGD